MPELTWTLALAWFGIIASGLTAGGLVGVLVASLVGRWRGRREDRRLYDHRGL